MDEFKKLMDDAEMLADGRVAVDMGEPRTGWRDIPLARNVAAFGELGLSGEVRNVSHTIRRATEATKLGFTRVIAPENAKTLVAAIDLALAR